MKCSSCQIEHPVDALFCMKCGTKLERNCPHCATHLPKEALFCMKCGKNLIAEDTPAEKSQEKTAAEAERRQLTVMFCDLVGSTPLSAQLDPEDLREVVRVYQETCGKVIRRFEGHIAQYLGDGLLVYFGYPQAHEDDAQRAVRAGLGMVEAIIRLKSLLQEKWGIELAVRVGIHTGLVVAGEVGSGTTLEHLAMGETPNIANRLLEEADPNSVVVSAYTYRLIEGFFAYHKLGNLVLKGLSQPMGVYQVRHESSARSRLDAMAQAELTPLVGREQELGLLFERWEQVNEGMGQVVLLGGEAGIGKSRLVLALKEHVAQDPQAWLTPWQCSTYHQNSALYPLIDLLERVVLQFERGDDPTEKLSRLEGFLVQYGFHLPDVVPLFANLLSLPIDEKYAPSSLSPEQQKLQIFQTFLGVLLEIAARQPLLLVMEDLHWADPTTLEFLDLLVDQIPTTRILALFTFRPEFRPPWSGRAHLTTITLHRLTQNQVADMIQHLAAGKTLPREVFEQILSKTDGVPLFVEELTKMVRETGLLREEEQHYELVGSLPPLAIPATLQDSLMARLDRLASVKEVVQLGATLGRELTYEMLQAMSALDEKTLLRGLRQLVEAELLYQRGIHPKTTYIFKHALIQETAYQSLLKSTRQQYHQRIAEVLVNEFPETVNSQPELIAHHYTEAGLYAQAVKAWRFAGQHASEHSAYLEAAVCFEKALGALTHLPESRETLDKGIDLRIDLRNVLHPLGEHQRLFDYMCEAEPLAERLDDQRRLGWIACYKATYFSMTGDPDRAVESGQRALAIAEAIGQLPLQVAANFRLGLAYLTNDYCRASAFFRSNVESLQGELIREYFGESGPASVLSRFWLVPSLAELGEFAEGMARGEEAIQISETMDHPWSLLGSYHCLGYLYLRKGDLDKAIPILEGGLVLSQDYPLFWLPWLTSSLGYAYALSGRVAEALPLIEQGIEEATLKKQWRYYALQVVYLSETYRLSNRMHDAIQLARQALDAARKYKARGQEPWALKLLGEIAALKDTADMNQTEVLYQEALSLADELSMRPLQAHLHRDLGTLFSKMGKLEQARTELSTAIKMYSTMEMKFWLPQVEAEIDQVEKQ